ncbi:MAG: pentapeptide repeat-containing protein [bacterium]|nr:pentapeptide repeat-containing protein [bacterium]
MNRVTNKNFHEVFERNSEGKLDISGTLIDGIVVEKIELDTIDSFDSIYLNCYFEKVSFSAAWFSGSIFKNCKFKNCIFTDTQWGYVSMSNCNFKSCFFGKAEFFRVQIVKTNFKYCDFRYAKISESIINKSIFLFLKWPEAPERSPKPEIINNILHEVDWNEASG